MHFPFDHSSHFKCVCTNSMSEVGKNIGNTHCGIIFSPEGRGLEEGTLPFPASEHSFTLSRLCPAQHSTPPQGTASLLIHPASLTSSPEQWEQPFGGMHCPGFTFHTLGWCVLHVCSVSLLSVCPAPSRCHGRESCTPAKLQCDADGSHKHQASKQKLPNSNDSRTDKTLNRASDKHSCKGVGGGKWDHFVHSLFTAEQRDGTSFSQAHELSEVKNESAGNRIRGHMNGFPLTWDMSHGINSGKTFVSFKPRFSSKAWQNYSKCSRNALKNQFKIWPQRILNSSCPYMFPVTVLSASLNLNTILLPQWPRSLTWPGSIQCSLT